MVYAWYVVWGDNFNDDYLAYYWHVLVNSPYSTVQETEECIKMYVPSELPNWRSAALKLDNFNNLETGTWVWVDVTSWGSGYLPRLWVGPRLGELILSNEIFDDNLIRYGVKREYYFAGSPYEPTIHSRVMATVQYGGNTYILNTLYDVPGPEQGYTIAFGLHHYYDYQDSVGFYFWTSYPDHDVGTLYWMASRYWELDNHPYPIFGIYSCYQENRWWFGNVKFDDFNVYHD